MKDTIIWPHERVISKETLNELINHPDPAQRAYPKLTYDKRYMAPTYTWMDKVMFVIFGILVALFVFAITSCSKPSQQVQSPAGNQVGNSGDSVRLILTNKLAKPTDTVYWQVALYGSQAILLTGNTNKTTIQWKFIITPNTLLSEVDAGALHYTNDSSSCQVYVNGHLISVTPAKLVSIQNPAASFYFQD